MNNAFSDEPQTIAARLKALGYEQKDLETKIPQKTLSLSVYGSSFSNWLKDNVHKLGTPKIQGGTLRGSRQGSSLNSSEASITDPASRSDLESKGVADSSVIARPRPAEAISPPPPPPINANQHTPPADNQVFKLKLDLNFNKLKYLLLFLAVATGLTGGILGIFAYQKFVPENAFGPQIIADRAKLTQKQIEKLVEKVSKITSLPDDELPKVVVLTDITQLKSNPFFNNAQVGDMLMVYKNAQKALVYNPENNRIVNMGPYNAEADKSAQTPSLTPLASPLTETEASQGSIKVDP